MTREQKLALIMGFALVLVVGVLVSDHLSRASRADALSTDGLDGGLAQRPTLDVNPTLIVNNTALNSDTFATPEPAYDVANERRTPTRDPGFFDGVSDQVVDTAREFGELPTTLKLTEGHSSRVPEIEMGGPVLTIGRPDPARVYRVKPNDSLWGIAEREYDDGALHSRLAEYNHDRIGSGGTLREGASLLIPAKDVLLAYRRGDERLVGSGRARETRPAPTTREEPRVRTRTHVVKKGETLSEICMDLLGTSKRWREVVELNNGNIDDDGGVRIGQEILLPAD